MAGKILVGSSVENPLYTFDNSTITSCQVVLSSSLSGDELAVDQFMPVVYSGGIATQVLFSPAGKLAIRSSDGKFFSTVGSDRKYPDSVPYGTPIYYFDKNNNLMGKFYTQRIIRSGRNRYDIISVSAIGILDGQSHNGGLYDGQTFEEVAADIIGEGFSFTCAEDVAKTTIFGWLPIGSRRENLHQLLFATGAALYKDSDGEIVFRFPDSDTVKQIPSSRIFAGGNIDYMEPATRAEVTEHTFRTSNHDESVTLFDNTVGEYADNVFVSFQNAPIYGLETTGTLEIVESGANYAILSGFGELTGKKYTHVTRVLSANSGAYNEREKTVSVTDATLVNTVNSENVLRRVLSFYSSARTIRNDIVLQDEQAGDQVSFENPYGEREQAFIASLDIDESSFMRAACEMVTGYVPTGGGNNYSSYVLLTGSGTWTIPAEVLAKDYPIIRAILIGGGQGGQCGANGAGGGRSPSGEGAWRDGGAGGAPGVGGIGGKIFSINVDCYGKTTIDYVCGNGGAGASGGSGITDGAFGGATVFGDLTSESGQATDVGIVNIFTGTVYGQTGTSGISGGKGGSNGAGESVTFEGVTYVGGAQGALAAGYGYGGAGGGAAVGASGGNGAKGTTGTGGSGGAGGSGGSATARPAATGYGNGGNGGHGGGGGGAGGPGAGWPGAGGAGGRGGNGGAAAPGCILIYY